MFAGSKLDYKLLGQLPHRRRSRLVSRGSARATRRADACHRKAVPDRLLLLSLQLLPCRLGS